MERVSVILRTTKTRSKRGELPFVGGLSLYVINITDKKAACFVCNLTSFFEKSSSFLFVLFATVPHACERA